MYKCRLGMAVNEQFGAPLTDQMKLLRQVGFEAFFVNWKPGLDLMALRRTADEIGLIFQSVHGPAIPHHLMSMWYESEHTREAADLMIRCLEECAQARVPIMVCHAFCGFHMHTPTELGLQTFGRVVAAAERLHVKIAFENTEGEEYLAALLETFGSSPWVGYCWDVGHEMCYTHRDLLEEHGHLLICTHLNDNLGTRDFDGELTGADDLHLLPFDGIGDWSDITRRLTAHNFHDILTFELKVKSHPGRFDNDPYARMALEDYFTLAYNRCCRVAALKLRAEGVIQ